MKIPVEQISESLSSTEKMWNIFKCLEVGEDIDKRELEQVKFGVKIKFDIRMLFRDTNHIKVLDKPNKVMINGEIYTRFPDYQDELDEREKIMTEAIIRNVSNTNPLKPRD